MQSIETKGRLHFIEKVSTFVPVWSIFMQMINLNMHSGANSVVLIGRLLMF